MTPVTDSSDRGYHAPVVQDLGSVEELTEQYTNKIGSAADQFTGQVPVVGKVITIP